MASIIKVDQIQSDTGVVNLASNIQFASGVTMASPTISSPTITSGNIANPSLTDTITVPGTITSNVVLTANASTRFVKQMTGDGIAFEVKSDYPSLNPYASIVAIGQSSSDGYIAIGDPATPAGTTSDIFLSAAQACQIKNPLHLGTNVNASYSYPLCIWPGTPRGTGGNARIKIGTHILDSYANDDMYIRGYNSETTGALLYVGNYYTFSARSIKTNLVPLANSLSKICSLQGYSYTIKDTDRDNIGLIADEVEEVYPDLVAHDTETGEANSVDYSSLVAALIEAVKELKTELDSVKSELDTLKNA